MQHLIDFVNDYAIRRDCSREYRNQLAWCVSAYSKHLGRAASLSDLTATTINGWLAAMKDAGLAPETRKSRRRMLLSMSADAARIRLVDPVQRDLVAQVKGRGTVPDGLSYEEAGKIVRVLGHRGGPHERWLRFRYRKLNGISRREWWRAFMLASWDTGAPADLRLLYFQDIGEDGRVFLMRHKTGKRLRWQLSPGTMDAINTLQAYGHLQVFPLPGRLEVFRREARHIITEIAGLKDKSLGGFRSGAGTDAELTHGNGAGSKLLGHVGTATFEKHYAIPSILQKEILAPRPIEV